MNIIYIIYLLYFSNKIILKKMGIGDWGLGPIPNPHEYLNIFILKIIFIIV